jgi:hypothetical protein
MLAQATQKAAQGHTASAQVKAVQQYLVSEMLVSWPMIGCKTRNSNQIV